MVTTKPKKIFGTDGVRGRANYSPMTVETALALGRAAALVLKNHTQKHRVVIGKDTRLSCYMFENALISGFCSMGIDTYMVGPLPTPGVAYITRAYRADAGVVISASHNPFQDNGIKFFSSRGFKFADEWEARVESLIENQDYLHEIPMDREIGKNTKIDDACGRYVEFVKSSFSRRHSLRGVKIALDCANGAAYRAGPLVFNELEATVVTTGVHPNGLNINDKCGSLHPENVRQLVLESQANVGIAFDGDADRIIMIDEKGNIIDGDILLGICAKNMKDKGLLNQNKIVSTVMCNLGLIEAMKRAKIETIQAPVGDRYVIQEMLNDEINLGGEQSGHLIFLDYNTTGDGLVSALQVLNIMIEENKTLSELASFIQLFPQTCLNVAVGNKPPLRELATVQNAIKEVQQKLGSRGRVLVRYSGTEMLCRVMVEGEHEDEVQRFAQMIASSIEQAIGISNFDSDDAKNF